MAAEAAREDAGRLDGRSLPQVGERDERPDGEAPPPAVAARIVLGIQATACLTVALYAWIPGAANPAQWAIIGTLIAQAVLIIGTIAFYASLTSCATTPVEPGGGSGPLG